MIRPAALRRIAPDWFLCPDKHQKNQNFLTTESKIDMQVQKIGNTATN
jgi:hypothetical protein